MSDLTTDEKFMAVRILDTLEKRTKLLWAIQEEMIGRMTRLEEELERINKLVWAVAEKTDERITCIGDLLEKVIVRMSS
jgi:hypothetical protein